MRAERSGKKPGAAAVTPWFPATVRPVRVGVYECELAYLDRREKHWWDGARWFIQVLDFVYFSYFGNEPGDKWRGLSTNPNEPKRGQRTK